MAITAGVSGQNSTASGTSITTTISAPTVGDLMIAVGTATTSVGTLSIDGSGWTERVNETVAAGPTIRTVIWTRVVTATSETSYTLTSTNTDTLNLHLVCFSGITTPVVDAIAVEVQQTGDATSIAFGPLTTIASESLAFLVLAAQTTFGDNPSTPFGWAPSPAKLNRRLNTFYLIGAPATLTDTITWPDPIQDTQTIIVSFASGDSATGAAAITHARHAMAASGSSTTGTAAVANKRQTSAAVLVHGIAGTAAIAPTRHSVAASGSQAAEVTGTAAVTHAAHAIEASGLHAAQGAAAITHGAHTVAAAGAHSTTGTATIANGAHVVAAAGGPTVTGTAAVVNGVHVVEGGGTPAIAGQAAITHGAHVAYGGGTALYPVATFVVTSTKPWYHADIIVKRRRDYVIPVGIPVTGTAAILPARHEVSATSAQTVVGVAAVLPARHDTAAAGWLPVEGTAAAAHSAHVVAAVGAQAFAGFGAVVNGVHVPAAVGVVGVTGTAGPQVAAHAVAGVGGTSVAGEVGVTPTRHVVAATGARGATGTFSRTNARHVVSASGSGGVSTWNATSFSNPFEYSLGVHSSSSQLAGMRSRTGMPFKMMGNAPGGVVLTSTYDWSGPLARLNFETGTSGVRVHAGFHWWWDSNFILPNGDDPEPSRQRMEDVSDGTLDVRLDYMGARLAAMTNDQLSRLVIRYPHEIGLAYAKWQWTEELNEAQNMVRAALFAAACRRTKDRVDAALGARAGLLRWEYNMTAVNNSGRRNYIETAWPGNSYVNLVSFDAYAGVGDTAPALQNMMDYVTTFASARGNKPIGLWETGPLQHWGSELQDVQASVQIPFYEALEAQAQVWQAAGRWAGALLFEQDKNPPTTPDGNPPAGGGEGVATRLFVPRAQSLGTSRLSWTAQVGARPAWACNYPDLAERVAELFS